jgi:hypothetical protein
VSTSFTSDIQEVELGAMAPESFPITFALIVVAAAIPLFFAIVITHDRVIRDVCKLEGLNYPVLWFLRPSWTLRFGESSWFRLAMKTRYFKLDIALSVLWLILMLSFFAVLASNGISMALR